MKEIILKEDRYGLYYICEPNKIHSTDFLVVNAKYRDSTKQIIEIDFLTDKNLYGERKMIKRTGDISTLNTPVQFRIFLGSGLTFFGGYDELEALKKYIIAKAEETEKGIKVVEKFLKKHGTIPKERKEVESVFKCTTKQREEIARIAANNGMTMSEYILSKVLEHDVKQSNYDD